MSAGHARALLIVLDSVGIGGAPDAAAYGDDGADTLGHICEACAAGRGDRAGLRSGRLRLPNLARLGIGHAHAISVPGAPGLSCATRPQGAWGAARETSRGKDTVSGHWEIAGVPVTSDWGYFPDSRPAFPASLVAALCTEARLPGILGDRRGSGTALIDELGAEHIRTGRPICYTSADSVFQIAAHEEAFGLEHLLEVARVARRLCDPDRIGRVIARPFVGSAEAGFHRTANRKDFPMPPPDGTLLERLAEGRREVVCVGKIGDIFAHRATGREIKPEGNDACLAAALAAFHGLAPGGLVFANLVDFDTEHGHRRDVAGYAAALERFDEAVPAIVAALRPGDLCLITADHGNDPTFRGTDHTREQVPVLAFGPDVAAGTLGLRPTLADIGATLADHLGIAAGPAGRSFAASLRAAHSA